MFGELDRFWDDLGDSSANLTNSWGLRPVIGEISQFWSDFNHFSAASSVALWPKTHPIESRG